MCLGYAYPSLLFYTLSFNPDSLFAFILLSCIHCLEEGINTGTNK